ncbi:hypothetical protein D3C76_1117280 [compost metagenome]
MLEFKLQTLALWLGHFVATGTNPVGNALGAAFQVLQLGQLRAELLLGIDGVLLRRVRLKQGHLIVQNGNFHFGESRGCDQGRSQYCQLGQLTHDALLQNPLSLAGGRP